MIFFPIKKLPAAVLLASWTAGIGHRNPFLYYAHAANECTSDADCILFFRGCRLENEPDDPPVCACDARAGYRGDSFDECAGASETNLCLCAGCLPDSNVECVGYAAVCQQGGCSLVEDTPEPSTTSGCESDDECELFSDYCGGCNCRAKRKGISVPPCPNPVNCFIDPCDPSVFDLEPFCVGTGCAAASPSSVCQTPRNSCMNDSNWWQCKDLEDAGCQDILVMESCPLQFACNDEPDGPTPFYIDDPNSCTGNKLTVANVNELEVGQALCTQTREISVSRRAGGQMWYQFGLLDDFAPGTLHLLKVDYGPVPPSVKVVWSALDNAGDFVVGNKVKLMADGNLALVDNAGNKVWDTGCKGDNSGNKLVLKHVKPKPGKDSTVIKLREKSKPRKWIVKESGKETNTCD